MAHLVLDAPPGNEMDARFFDALGRLTAQDLPALGPVGVVVHGRGRHFSSGAKVDQLRDRISGATREAAQGFLRQTSTAFDALAALPAPTVAAISGVCFGSGLELALACRFRVAAKNAMIALPETSLGRMPGCGGTVRLPALVGLGRAVELILTGQSVSATEALEMGLVDRVVPRQELLDTARRLILNISGEQG